MLYRLIVLLLVVQVLVVCAKEEPVKISKKMIINTDSCDNAEVLFDEKKGIASSSIEKSKSSGAQWGASSAKLPLVCEIDLGKMVNVSSIYLYDRSGQGEFLIEFGAPGDWKLLSRDDGVGNRKWKKHRGELKTRYLRFVKNERNANFSEVVIFEDKKANFGLIPKSVLDAQKKEKAERERLAKLSELLEARKSLPRTADAGLPYGELPLIDEINCGDVSDKHALRESEKGVSKIEEILGRKCRVLPREGNRKYYAYRIGENAGLEAGKAYVLTVEYPEDKPRTIMIMNNGSEMNKGIATGSAPGDCIDGYTDNNLESLDIPLSGKYRTWSSVFRLHDHTSDLEVCRVKFTPQSRSLTPKDGFTVVISQVDESDIPYTSGAAVARIRLFAMPDPEKYDNKLVLPPKDLPRRHLFYREEMADMAENEVNPSLRAVEKVEDWYKYKMELMKYLGMNTFCKDLLEFGRNQGFDARDGGAPHGWYIEHKFPDLWKNLVELTGKFGFDLLPYYEYSGSNGRNGLGSQHLSKPLGKNKTYTHILWNEKFNLDITDPQSLEDAKKLLKFTILRHKDKANFIGAIFRPRTAQIPVSFSDRCLEMFAKEHGVERCKECGGSMVTREKLAEPGNKVYPEYIKWWEGKRRDFIYKLNDYLRSEGIPESVLIYHTYHTEPGPKIPGPKKYVVTDNPNAWKKALAKYPKQRAIPIAFDEAMEKGLCQQSALAPTTTWGHWEWQHACPVADPLSYKDKDGVMMSYPFHRKYTVSDAQTLLKFKTKSGLAMLRHFPLNEHRTHKDLGYVITDFERSGPYCMLSEVLAMANADPYYIGYLSGSCFSRGFSYYVRKFNSNFLALPAIESQIVKDASKDQEVVLRKTETPKDGEYFALMNTGLKSKKQVRVKFGGKGSVTEIVSGKEYKLSGGIATVDLDPCQLVSFHRK